MVTGEPVPREVLIYDEPGEGVFKPADYPWLVDVRAILKAANAGHNGYIILELYDVALPRHCCRCPIHSQPIGAVSPDPECPCLEAGLIGDDGRPACPEDHAEACHCTPERKAA